MRTDKTFFLSRLGFPDQSPPRRYRLQFALAFLHIPLTSYIRTVCDTAHGGRRAVTRVTYWTDRPGDGGRGTGDGGRALQHRMTILQFTVSAFFGTVAELQ